MSLREVGGIEELRTDAVVAKDLRDELSPLLERVCKIMGRAKAEGYGVSWNIQPDSFGRFFRVTEISVVKPL